MSEQYDIHNNQPATVSKAHQQRSCVVCSEPVIDHQAEAINIGGGLEALVHRACMAEVTEALAPKAVVIPVPASKPVKKSTVTKSYEPYDKDSLKERIRFEFTELLLQHGLMQ
jgi:hypothetical protein